MALPFILFSPSNSSLDLKIVPLSLIAVLHDFQFKSLPPTLCEMFETIISLITHRLSHGSTRTKVSFGVIYDDDNAVILPSKSGYAIDSKYTMTTEIRRLRFEPKESLKEEFCCASSGLKAILLALALYSKPLQPDPVIRDVNVTVLLDKTIPGGPTEPERYTFTFPLP
jgi:hypothetical protein